MATKYQKKVLSFLVLASLAVVLLVNAFLTVWIMTATGLGIDGISSLRLGSRFVEAGGRLMAMRSLYANKIKSVDQLSLFSAGNITLSAYDDTLRNSLIQLDDSTVTLVTDKFRVKASNGRKVLESSLEATKLTTKKLAIEGVGGQTFRAGIETQAIRAGAGNSLKIKSLVGSVDLMGPQNVNVASFAGPISMQALSDITIRSKGRGTIQLNAGSILMPRLNNSTSGRVRHNKVTNFKTYQLCSCVDGRLFVAKPDSHCVADYHICPST